MTAQAIASKFRRALRNGTGASFTQEQMQELALPFLMWMSDIRIAFGRAHPEALGKHGMITDLDLFALALCLLFGLVGYLYGYDAGVRNDRD